LARKIHTKRITKGKGWKQPGRKNKTKGRGKGKEEEKCGARIRGGEVPRRDL
jgi:hypothetical protein